MLNKSTMPLTAKQISVMDKNNKFNYDHLVQRGLVWERARKSALIESMILGYPVPQIYCRRNRDENNPKKGNSTYVIMDGKQRLTTVASFLRNEWILTKLPEITYQTFDEEEVKIDISGKTFEELPEELQDAIKDTSFSFVCFENITPEEERELFKRLNAGKPLSTKARVLANCRDLESILEIGNHPLFSNMMTENAISQKNQVTVIMKIWMMITENITDISFESKYFNPIVENTILKDEEKLHLVDIFNYMEEVHENILMREEKDSKKLAKKFYTETHLVSLSPFINEAVIQNIDVKSFAEFVIDFFRNLSEKEQTRYDDATLRGSAKGENIWIRHDIIQNAYYEFYKENYI